jgi:hypothetical protein
MAMIMAMTTVVVAVPMSAVVMVVAPITVVVMAPTAVVMVVVTPTAVMVVAPAAIAVIVVVMAMATVTPSPTAPPGLSRIGESRGEQASRDKQYAEKSFHRTSSSAVWRPMSDASEQKTTQTGCPLLGVIFGRLIWLDIGETRNEFCAKGFSLMTPVGTLTTASHAASVIEPHPTSGMESF